MNKKKFHALMKVSESFGYLKGRLYVLNKLQKISDEEFKEIQFPLNDIQEFLRGLK